MNMQVFIKTFGCALNKSDSEAMAGLLKKAEFDITENIDKADVIIVNTCTVKGPSEKNFFNCLKDIKKLGKPIVVAGCIPQTDPEKVRGYNLIGTYEVSRIAEVVEEAVNDNVVELVAEKHSQRLNLPKSRSNNIIEIIPICAGCMGEPCSYCKVKSARGNLFSYYKNEIIKQAENAVKDGVLEIWITSQDTGCYGKDIDSSLPELLRELVKLEGDFKIRLGMANPNHILEFLDELIEIYKSDRMFKFLHVPVQSGSDRILKLMKRKYTADDFKKIISRFRKEIPGITISTDVILGFPSEAEEDYDKTRDLIK
ncbi:tRNA (N(6)-L-threonylcarbamoyladenosine(37)-C(2))-methylthiotransferase [Candidatus Woesearchaeota archaeon]|nr:tRNA (N(6)-L-threonylcarbamoyladenosine(37)-C(2))-methylthiotransferase [Candidatus Woesearchaeota archaeon]